MSIEKQRQRAQDDNFSSSDDENFLSPVRDNGKKDVANKDQVEISLQQLLPQPVVNSTRKITVENVKSHGEDIFPTPTRPARKRRRPRE